MKKIFVAIFVIIVLACMPIVHVDGAMAVIDMVWANPSANCENEMNISFQSAYSSASVEYTLAADKTFSNKIVVRSTGESTPKAYDGNKNYFHHSVTLTGLEASTNYIYRILAGNTKSDVHSFKTSGVSGNFNFAIIGDIHSDDTESGKMKSVDKLITKTEELTSSIGGIDFILSYGDMVKYGESYDDWQQWNNCAALNKYMLAPICGNKEYYNVSHTRVTNQWFTSMFNNPKNGVEGLESTYYFIYNNILFVALDGISEEGSAMKGYYASVEAQTEWFEEVMKAMEGKYQYSIVYRHYPFFTEGNGTGNHEHLDWGGWEDWAHLFDKYDVDLLLAGDSHCYVRSERIYNDQVSTDETKGTVYMTGPQIYTSWYGTTLTDATNDLMVKYHDGSTTGSMYCTVNNDELTLYLLASDNKSQLNILDQVTIKAKRNLPIGDSKEKLESSFSFTANADKVSGIIDFDHSVLSYASSINVYSGETLIGNANPLFDNVSFVNVTGLNANAINDVKVVIEYTNGDHSECNLSLNTYDSYGEIYGFKINASAKTLTWEANLENDIVTEFDIYKGNEKIAILENSAREYQLASYDLSDTYTLVAVNASGEIIYKNSASYNVKYDANMDGAVNGDDVSKLASLIMGGHTFSQAEVNLFDTNNDGIINVCDISALQAIIAGNKEVKDVLYTVTFVDMNGNVIATKQVKYGEDAELPTPPTKTGYTFSKWSRTNKYITSNQVIRAIYTK